MDFNAQPVLYQQLEQHLQGLWQANQSLPARIRCGARQNRLLVLLEHEAETPLNPTESFALIQGWLSDLPTDLKSLLLGAGRQPQAGLYARIKSQKQPYASQLCKFPEMESIGPDSPALNSLDADALAPGLTAAELTPAERAAAGLPAPESAVSDLGSEDNVVPDLKGSDLIIHTLEFDLADSIAQSTDPTAADRAAAEASFLGAGAIPTDVGLPGADRAGDRITDFTPIEGEPFPGIAELEFEEEPPLTRDSFYVPVGVWVAGVGLVFTTFVGSFFLMSQPCLVRTCVPFEAAQRIGNDVTQMLQAANTWEDLERARSQLGLAKVQLDRVPSWSRYGLQAQQQRGRYQNLALAIEPVQAALKQATLATQKTQGDGLPIDTWREIGKSWDSVISQLKAIPSNSPLHSMAQDKLRQFEASQRQVQQRLAKEQEGQRLLVEARRLSAPLSDPSVRNDLGGTQARLQEIVELLTAVPKGTTAYTDAQQILSTYQSQLAAATNQQSQLQAAIDDYQRATESAGEAQRLEKQQDWEGARDQWQSAIATLQSIGVASPNYADAQARFGEYTLALKQTEQRASRSGAVAQARSALDGICSGKPTICTVEVSADRIAVRLTLEYQQAVLTAGTIGDADSKVEAVDHVKTLELALQATSNNSQIPLELYDPDGTLVGTHTPLKP
jgi:tetratricopeptide (TPR) repeat protein